MSEWRFNMNQLFLVVCVFFLVSCIEPLENKKEKKPELTEAEKLQAVYDDFGTEPRDYVQQDQLAEGLKWYPDTELAPAITIEDPIPFGEATSAKQSASGAKLRAPFLLSIYNSAKPKSIELFYSLDKSLTDQWKLFYEVENLYADKVALTIDYQDLKLFTFDYYLPPELLKFTFIWLKDSKEIKHDFYIDPHRQAKNVYLKGDKLKGIVSKGVFGSKTVLLKNLSGVSYHAAIAYDDARDGEKKTLEVDIATKVSRLVQIPEFMSVDNVTVTSEQQAFSKQIPASDLFKNGALFSCLLMDYQGTTASATIANTQNFSVCFDGKKDYSAWVSSLMPEMAKEEAEKDEDSKVPKIKGL